MLRPAGTLPLLLLLLLASAGGQQPDCDLGQPDALSGCVKSLLESLRNDVHQSSDPLHLDRQEGCRGKVCHTISDVVIHGLSTYNIDHLDVSFPEETSLAVRAAISWPRLRGNFHARLKAERRKFPRIKASVSAEAEIRVDNPVGELDVTIRLDVAENGAVTATPASTSVTVRLGDIDVDVRPGGFGGFVDRLIGNPTSKIAELVVSHYWKDEWRPKVEREAKEALERAIVEKLGEQLSKLLHV